jgi:LysM repeat protein
VTFEKAFICKPRYNFGMKRFWILVPLLLLTLNLIPSEQVGARPVNFSPNLTAVELITKVNELRAAKKLPPYKTNSILTTVAQAHVDYIAKAGVMTHFNANGTPPYQRAIKAGYPVAGDLSQGGLFFENIGSGAGLTASDIVSAWQDDAKDLQTMISADLVDVGAGVAVMGGTTYYVLDAGASTADSETPPASVTKTPLAGTQPAISTPLEDGTVYHLVQANEALWSIALNYNTTIENLKLLNRLSSNDIYEGQKLLIRKPQATKTITPTILPSATFGIPTSTATQPVTPTVTSTATPLPVPPTSRQSGVKVVGIIILTALIAAGAGSWLGKRKTKLDSNSGAEND